MLYLNQNSLNNVVFNGHTKQKKIISKSKQIFNQNFPNLQSPSYILATSRNNLEKNINWDLYDILNTELTNIRSILNPYYSKNDARSYFDLLLRLVKNKKVVNCNECAEISNIILKLNGINNADLFQLYAKSKDGKERFLDHTITAIGINKKQNNKKISNLFKPKNKVVIFDMWFNGVKGLIVKYGNLKNKLKKILNLKEEEEIVFKPINTLKINEETIQYLKKIFPELLF